MSRILMPLLIPISTIDPAYEAGDYAIAI